MPSTKNDTPRIRIDGWDALQDHLIPLRMQVFVEEQNVPLELELDDEDATATHVLALDSHETPLGCARLLPSGQIGRMAVLAPFRGQGVGTRLLAAAEDEACRQGMTSVFLHAQTHAIPFYQHNGYTVCSDEFIDAGIPHRSMQKPLFPARR